MKKFASAGIGVLAVVVAVAMMAGPADARAHRHHRHHRHGGGGGGVVCGPGTVLSGGTCVPAPAPTPTAHCFAANNPAQIQGAGSPIPGAVVINVVCENLTPNI